MTREQALDVCDEIHRHMSAGRLEYALSAALMSARRDAKPLREAFEQLHEALKLAREYVKKVHGTLVPAMGEDNLVSPDLAKVDEALKRAEEVSK